MYEIQKSKLINCMDSQIYEILQDVNCIIAGGAITSVFCNKEINDIDVYFRTKEDLRYVLEEIDGQVTVMCYTDKSITCLRGGGTNKRTIFQFIFFDFFKTPADIFEAFDFSCCMGAFDCKTEEFVLHEDFFASNAARVLNVIGKTRYPFSSLFRVKKYEDRGYTISKKNMMKLCLMISKQKIESWEDIVVNIGGIYGESFGFNFDQKKDFSIEEAINQVDEVSITTNHDNIESDFNIKEYVVKITGLKIRCVVFGNDTDVLGRPNEYGSTKQRQSCLVKEGGEWKVERYNPDIHDKVEWDDVFSRKLYKVVTKDAYGKMFSCHTPSFEYTIGKEVKDEKNGIYFSFAKHIGYWETMFKINSRKIAYIEAEFNPDDIIEFRGDKVVLKRATILREITRDEVYEIANIGTKKESSPFDTEDLF